MSDTTCPVLRPTAEEFRDFRSYLRTLDKYHSAGIVKVIPPKECVFKRDYDPAHLDMELSHYYEQASRRIENDGGKGIYDIQLKWREAPISLAEFKDLLDTSEDIPNVRGDDNAQKKVWAKRESKFWRLMGDKSAPVPKYAGDVNVSLFGNDAAHSWNLNRLDSLLQTVGTALRWRHGQHVLRRPVSSHVCLPRGGHGPVLHQLLAHGATKVVVLHFD